MHTLPRLLVTSLLAFGCATVPSRSAATRSEPTALRAEVEYSSFETSCPGGIPRRFPADLVIELERDGQRWTLVDEQRACAADLIDSMPPPLGWNHPPRRCASVPQARLRAVYDELRRARIDRIRVRDPDPLPSGTAIGINWRNGSSSCRVGAVERETQIHRGDREAFAAAVAAIESILLQE